MVRTVQASIKIVGFFLIVLCASSGAAVNEATDVEDLLQNAGQHLSTAPEKSVALLERLKELQPSLTPSQDERFHLIYASSLGFRGRHEERVAMVQAYMPKVHTPVMRTRFLYEVVDGTSALGRYEEALKAMNEAILLLPELQNPRQELTVLQSAFALFSTLRAYEDAISFAQRIFVQGADVPGSFAKCVGLTDKVEVHYLSGNNPAARALVPDAIQACDANKNELLSLINRTYLAIDLIDTGHYSDGIAASLPLLNQFALLSDNSDYLTQLEEAIARAYLKTGNTERAERFGLKAYQRAESGKALQLQEKTSLTMAAIKRAQGELVSALNYYDINLALKSKVLDDQLHRNLAYQRVKFDNQDKANQLALLEQKNKILSTETALQRGRYQNVVLLLTLGLVALVILGGWLAKTLKQSSFFRQSAQIDGLTQVSNRAHFTECSQQMFGEVGSTVSLILFDMDLFKRINDTYGHPAGDWVLKTVCETVQSQLRRAEVFGRLGGEEFALCLPDTGPEEAMALAERCRVAIAGIDSTPSGFSFTLSASFGIATHTPTKPLSFEEALAAADKALYLSKTEGRNRVSAYTTS